MPGGELMYPLGNLKTILSSSQVFYQHHPNVKRSHITQLNTWVWIVVGILRAELVALLKMLMHYP